MNYRIESAERGERGIISTGGALPIPHASYRTRSPRRGFTLIETFVAITILVTAVAGPLTIASKGLTSSLVARDQLTASFLAQEAIEYVRQKRDTNHLQGNASWLTGLDNCINQDCTIDVVTDTEPEACLGACEPLRYDTTTNFYGYDPLDDATVYARSLRIVPLASGYEAEVRSTVRWQSSIFTREVVLSEVITDWQ